VADAERSRDHPPPRHPQEQRTIPRRSLPFFPGWELLDKAGRKAARQPTTDTASSTAKPADTTTEE
jgi:hypothetical protein